MPFMQNRPDLTHRLVINSKLKKTMSHLRYQAHDVFDTCGIGIVEIGNASVHSSRHNRHVIATGARSISGFLMNRRRFRGCGDETRLAQSQTTRGWNLDT